MVAYSKNVIKRNSINFENYLQHVSENNILDEVVEEENVQNYTYTEYKHSEFQY